MASNSNSCRQSSDSISHPQTPLPLPLLASDDSDGTISQMEILPLKMQAPSSSSEESPGMVFTSIQASEASLPESVLPLAIMPRISPDTEQSKSDLPRLDSSASSLDLHFDDVAGGWTSEPSLQHSKGAREWYL